MHPVCQKPIPVCHNPPTAAAYGVEAFDSNHPQTHEPLVNIADYGLKGENFYNSKDAQNAPYAPYLKGVLKHVWCRKSVAEKLVQVQQQLTPLGMELWLMDGYRSIDCQRALWQWITEETAATKGLAGDDLIAYCAQYVSNPTAFNETDPATWPTHSTGGAVDVTLRYKDGTPVSMGEDFDGMGHTAHTDYLERQTNLSDNQKQALQNRRLLFWLMTEAGFAGYPYEYWHFDYGTQMGRMNMRSWGFEKLEQQPAAWYGYISAPTEE